MVAPALFGVYKWVAGVAHPVPVLSAVLGTPSSGRNFLRRGLIVAIMIIPIITSITREVYATVPEAEKQAAPALGATR